MTGDKWVLSPGALKVSAAAGASWGVTTNTVFDVLIDKVVADGLLRRVTKGGQVCILASDESDEAIDELVSEERRKVFEECAIELAYSDKETMSKVMLRALVKQGLLEEVASGRYRKPFKQ